LIQRSLFLKELHENKLKFFLLAAGFLAAAWAIPLLYDPHYDLNRIGFFCYINLQDGLLITDSYSNFAWSRWSAQMLTFLASAAAMLFGAGAVNGETRRGTALFLLSKPITRREIYTTKTAAGLIQLAICAFGSTLFLILISFWKGYWLQISSFLITVTITFAGAAVLYLASVALSSVLSDPLKTLLATAAIWLFLFVPGYLNPSIARYTILSQMSAASYWLAGSSPIVPLGFFLVLAGIFYELGFWLWSRQDV